MSKVQLQVDPDKPQSIQVLIEGQLCNEKLTAGIVKILNKVVEVVDTLIEVVEEQEKGHT